MTSCLALANKKSKCRFQAQVTLEQLCSVPFVNGTLFAKLRLLHGRHQCQYSDRIPIDDYSVKWNRSFTFRIKLGRNADLSLESCYLKVSIRQEVRGGKGTKKLGFVTVNLSCFADKGRKDPIRRRYILQAYDQKTRQNNALLYLNFNVFSNTGPTDHIWRLPEESLNNQVPLDAGGGCKDSVDSSEMHIMPTLPSGTRLPHSDQPYVSTHIVPPPSSVVPSLYLHPAPPSHLLSSSASGFTSDSLAPIKSSNSGTSENSQVWRSAGSTSDSNNMLTDGREDIAANDNNVEKPSYYARKNSTDSWKSFPDEHMPVFPSTLTTQTSMPAASSHSRSASPTGLSGGGGGGGGSLSSEYSQDDCTVPPLLSNVFAATSSCAPSFSQEGGYYSASTVEELSCETTSEVHHRRQPSSLSGISLLLWSTAGVSSGGGAPNLQQRGVNGGGGGGLGGGVGGGSGQSVKQHSRQASLDSGCHPYGHSRTGCNPTSIFDPSIERVKEKRSGEKQSLIDSSRANNDQVVSEILRQSLHPISGGKHIQNNKRPLGPTLHHHQPQQPAPAPPPQQQHHHHHPQVDLP